ncbi:ecdysteroid-regulated 16 kDa protein-like [Physella acuta]|uniref:ecdysteroid-regulated 16 kDa protein-like n=1 Tax=Physella acuta TaxID=109671 RepID=UPI0027DDDDD7|nr:ecdysteroid-regulated 16 kDa protein-like [Physella acuta]
MMGIFSIKRAFLSSIYICFIIGLVSGTTIVKMKVNDFCPLLFKDCGSEAGTLSAVNFNGTCSGGKAQLQKGTVVAIQFTLSTKADEASLNSKVYGKIGVLPFVSFPLDNPDACKDSGLTCPVKANTVVQYLPVLNVLKSYPSVDVIVKWELQNKDGKNVFCTLIPASITG